jgi:hypothetical protein
LGQCRREDPSVHPVRRRIHAERRFGDLLLLSALSVGWWFETPRYAPFVKAHNHDISQF